jgi:hypothetical protein
VPRLPACFLPNFSSFGKAVSEEKIFLEINQSETRMVCGGHVCFVSDWLISKKSSPVKPLCHMNRNLVGSIYGRFSIKIAHFVLIH